MPEDIYLHIMKILAHKVGFIAESKKRIYFMAYGLYPFECLKLKVPKMRVFALRPNFISLAV